MILSIDIGNTTVAITVVERADDAFRILFSGRLPTIKDQKESDFLKAAWELMDPFDPFSENLQKETSMKTSLSGEKMLRKNVSQDFFEAAVISSVVPELNGCAALWVGEYAGRKPVFVTYNQIRPQDMKFAIPCPQKLGADRICDALGAALEYELPLITVDLGSATTFNVVDKSGEDKLFLGGIIAPGLKMGLKALSSGASLLPETKIRPPEHFTGRNAGKNQSPEHFTGKNTGENRPPEHFIGRDTAECIRLGTIVGTAAMIDGMAERIEGELGKKASLIITGGNSEYVVPFLKHEYILDKDILLKGMCRLAISS